MQPISTVILMHNNDITCVCCTSRKRSLDNEYKYSGNIVDIDSSNIINRKFVLYYYDVSFSEDKIIDFIPSDLLCYGIGLFHDGIITFITSDWTEI